VSQHFKEQKMLFKMTEKRSLYDQPFSRYSISVKATFGPYPPLYMKRQKKS